MIQCPRCQQENKPDNRFCRFCGYSLWECSDVSELSDRWANDTQSQQLKSLGEKVHRLTERVNTLEQTVGITTSSRPIHTTLAEVTPPSRPIPTPLAAVTPSPKPISETVSQERRDQPSKLSESSFARFREREWEQVLGGNWLARIGILLLTIGMAFFLKYAFDNDWLNPTTRVILGVFGGTVLLLGGHRWHVSYPIFAQALSGGGIALLYLSFFAAFAVYELIPFYPALVVLALISTSSVIIATRYNSMSLAILGIIGAFIAPFILGASAPETMGIGESGQGFQLLVYVMVVDLGIIALSTFRNWQWFTHMGLLGSLISYGVWYSQYGDRAHLLTSEGSLTLIFLIFVGATALYHIVWRRVPSDLDYVLMVINAAAYFGISYGLLWDDFHGWLGGFSLLLSFFYGGLAYIIYKRSAENHKLSLFALGITLVFLTVTIHFQWGDSTWTTLLWTAEAIALFYLSFFFRIPLLRIFSYTAYALTFIRLIFFDTAWGQSDFHLAFNERFLAYTIGIVVFYLTAYLIWRNRNLLLQWEKGLWSVYPIFLFAAIAVSIRFQWGDNAWITLVWAAEGIVLLLLSLSIRMPSLRISSYAVYALAFIRLIFFDTARGQSDFHLAFNEHFLVYTIGIVVFYVTAYLVWRNRDVLLQWEKGLMSIYPIFLVAAIAVSIRFQWGDNVWTTLVWTAEGIALLLLSLKIRMPSLRISSYAVYAIMGVRLIFVDTMVDLSDFHLAFNERFLAYIVGIAALYITAYLIRRNRNILLPLEGNWWSVFPIFLIAANVFSVWLISFEVWDYFGSRDLHNAQVLSLTAVWAIYAVTLLVVGIIRRSPLVRLMALALLAITITKVFIYDVFTLERVYRIVAFTGLGILLIVSGYLYQRYREVIKGFILKG